MSSVLDDGPFLTLAEYANKEPPMGRNAYAAQCLMCKYQRSRGNLVTGCLRFENSGLDGDTIGVLTGMLFQNSNVNPCPGRERLEVGPDAYRAQDLPEKP